MRNELFCQPKLCVYVGKYATKMNQLPVGLSLINRSDGGTYPSARACEVFEKPLLSNLFILNLFLLYQSFASQPPNPFRGPLRKYLVNRISTPTPDTSMF